MRQIAVLVLAATLGACATTGTRDPRDPMEGFNRGMWDFNQAVDKVAIKPATTVYRAVTPVPARRGFRRVIDNLFEPLNAINSLLQGKPDRALNSIGRFLVNSTIGVGGLADHASDMGLPPTPEDVGQTLAVWGFKNSPYLVLPIIGPSTIRDGIGLGTTFLLDPPLDLMREAGASKEARYVVTGLRFLQVRSEAMDSGVDVLIDTSADPYAAARDAYFQLRAAQIADNAGRGLSDDQVNELLNQALQEGQEASEGAEIPPDAAAPETPEPAPNPPDDAAVPQEQAKPETPRLSLILPSDGGIDY